MSFTSDLEKQSYAVGINVAQSLLQTGVELDAELVCQGLKDLLSGEGPKISGEELNEALMAFSQKAQEQKASAQSAAADENLQKGKAFLEENAKKDGVNVTDSGLQYEVLEEGTGEIPSESSTVKVHYKGENIEGIEFDSSYSRGEPTQFPVNGVIAGWTEALQLMKEGAKYKLAIPAEIAYGENGAGGAIGPNETLVFEVELLEVM